MNGDIIRVRLPDEQSYRNVKLHRIIEGGWWEAWLDSHGHTWSHQGVVHLSWQKGKGGARL